MACLCIRTRSLTESAAQQTCIYSANHRTAVKAKPAPHPGLPSWLPCFGVLQAEKTWPCKCDLRDDGTSGNCTLGRTAGPNCFCHCRSNISYTTKRERLHSLASGSFLSYEGATALWPKREVAHTHSWSSSRHLSFTGEMHWLADAL